MTAIFGALLAAAVSAPPPPAPPIRHAPLVDTWFLLPGVSYIQEIGTPKERPTSNGGGLELSVARHLGDEGQWVVGALVQAEKLHRARVALGGEVGYEFFGVEIAAARDFASEGSTRSQWSMQIAPYVSAGFLWVSARWVIALSDRAAADAPGDSAMLLVGFKIPIPFATGGGT